MKTTLTLRLSAILFLGFLPFISFGQNINTDRPSQSESSSTVPAGSLQIEGGFYQGYQGNQGNEEKQMKAPIISTRIGLSRIVELRVLSQYERYQFEAAEPRKGMNDLEVGAKFQLLKKDGINAEIALISHIIVPTGNQFFTSDRYGTVQKLSFGHSLGERSGLSYNIGWFYGGEGNGDLLYTLLYSYSINDRAAIYFEPYGDVANMEEANISANGGLTYMLRPNFQLDFAIGTGLNQYLNYLVFGFGWRIDPPKKD